MLKVIGKNIWTMDGPNVVFSGASMNTRMTIVKLTSGELWVHSPIKKSNDTEKAIQSLGGSVIALVAPNKFHYMYLPDWEASYPQARVFAEATLKRKVPSLQQAEGLTNTAPSLYSTDIDQVIMKGNRWFEEIAFFHKASKTLILTDLMMNLHSEHIKTLPRLYLKFEGALFPNGGIPRLYRWFTFNRTQARESLDVIRAWAPETVSFCHGEPFEEPALSIIEKQFSWLKT